MISVTTQKSEKYENERNNTSNFLSNILNKRQIETNLTFTSILYYRRTKYAPKTKRKKRVLQGLKNRIFSCVFSPSSSGTGNNMNKQIRSILLIILYR